MYFGITISGSVNDIDKVKSFSDNIPKVCTLQTLIVHYSEACTITAPNITFFCSKLWGVVGVVGTKKIFHDTTKHTNNVIYCSLPLNA